MMEKKKILESVEFDDHGLVPAIVQDSATREVLMMAYMNRDSLELTLDKGETYFYSRSPREIWHKGETSGNYLHLVSAALDCDGDALLFRVRPEGPACHTGRMSCFFNEVDGLGSESPADDDSGDGLAFDHNLLESVYKVILRRREEGDSGGSYVARLFERGEERILEKPA